MIKTVKIAWKDLKLLSRDWFGLFWLFVFPLIFAMVFGTIFASGQQGVVSFHLAVVNPGDHPQAQKMIERLRTEKGLHVTLHSRSGARDMVRSKQAAAYVQFPEISEGSRLFQPRNKQAIEIGIDPSRKAELSFLKGLLTQIVLEGFQRTGTPEKPNKTENHPDAHQPDSSFFQVTKIGKTRPSPSPSSSFAVSFPQAILWGLLACAAGFATSMVAERTGGTFLRMRMAPLHPLQLLIGKALACFLTCSTVILLLSFVGVLFFNVIVTQINVFVIALLCSSFCIVGLMMLISTLGETERAVGGSGWAIMAIMAMFGGGMVPLFTMPDWMKAVSDFSPVKWCIYLIEAALWRNLPAEQIWMPALILIGFGTFFFLIGLFNFYRLMRR